MGLPRAFRACAAMAALLLAGSAAVAGVCPPSPPTTWTNCLGALTNADGSRYSGGFRGGAYDGSGAILFANGESYVGGFRLGLENGQGVYNYAGGERYEGSFFEGRWEGQGAYIYPDGSRWVGTFHAGQRVSGVLYDAKGVAQTAAPSPAPPAPSAGEVDRIDVIAAGRFVADAQRRVEAPTTAAGAETEVGAIRLVESTRAITAEMGAEFGLRYRPVGKVGALVDVRKVVRFPAPGVTNPATGKTMASDEYVAARRVGDEIYDGYRISQPWEARPGTWTIELWVGERKLASESFEVKAP